MPKQLKWLLWLIFGFGIAMIIMLIVISIQMSQEAQGLAWKIDYSDFPELQEIYNRFVESCIVPDVPEQYYVDSLQNEVWQQTFKECQDLDFNLLETKYTKFETEPMEKSEWALEIQDFYSNKYMINNTIGKDVNELFAHQPLDVSQKKCQFQPRIVDFQARFGCFQRHVSQDLEDFAISKIQNLMKRYNLQNETKYLSDSRGSTFMGPVSENSAHTKGFMECHSNRHHMASWRLYMHYLPQNKGTSFFAYRHCFDKSLHTIPDSNFKANLFRIRKLPNELLWHSIYTSEQRFSWGLGIPGELAQYLRSNAINM